MSISSLENKTVRPGNLVNYTYYHAGNPPPTVQTSQPKVNPSRLKVYLLAFLLLLAIPLYFNFKGTNNPTSVNGVYSTHNSGSLATNNYCSSNSLDKFVKVSINSRKLWACNKNNLVYSSPVITGISTHPDTITPTGTYKIISKTQNVTLTGSDSVGSWNDPVKFWMPFLTNNYGNYGFHDATWRDNATFGNVSPSSNNASHGCVELPLGTANWLYNWLNVGTTVTITS